MVNLTYLETVLVHPTRRQSFAGKSDSTFYNIWDFVISLVLLSIWHFSSPHVSQKSWNSLNFDVVVDIDVYSSTDAGFEVDLNADVGVDVDDGLGVGIYGDTDVD